MRAIKKDRSHELLISFRPIAPITSQEAKLAWKAFSPRKRIVKNHFITEQFGLCAYSEISLENNFPITNTQEGNVTCGFGGHIEHIEPKSKKPERTFDYTNLVVSAIDDCKARDILKEDVFGGHAKGNWYEADAFISPLMTNCDDYFHYEASGKVIPKGSLISQSEKDRADSTIMILNLNAPLLIRWRKACLEQLDIMINETDDDDSLRLLAELELLPVDHLLQPFFSAKKAIFGEIGDEVCRQ